MELDANIIEARSVQFSARLRDVVDRLQGIALVGQVEKIACYTKTQWMKLAFTVTFDNEEDSNNRIRTLTERIKALPHYKEIKITEVMNGYDVQVGIYLRRATPN